MNNKATEEILYPKDVEANMQQLNTKLPSLFVVPRKSWNYISDSLVNTFEKIGLCNPSYIFVFSALHNGKIGFDDDYTIYTDSDCPVQNSILTKSDDVCSEEFGAEILSPFFKKYYPKAQVNQFLAPEKNSKNKEFFDFICKNYKDCLIFISKNETEDSVWPEHLQD